uniref:Uncharacterized protein n=1 Tax=Anguilla anguilla TaxID=7936 RepID=A0A0E9W3Y9_ANGAN
MSMCVFNVPLHQKKQKSSDWTGGESVRGLRGQRSRAQGVECRRGNLTQRSEMKMTEISSSSSAKTSQSF